MKLDRLLIDGFLLGIAILSAAASSSQCLAQSLPPAALADIVESRQTARSYVVAVKSYWDPSTPEYQTAKEKYNLAKAKYDGWIAYVTLSIVSASLSDLGTDQIYQRRCSDAIAAVNDFANYVDSLPKEVPGKSLFRKIHALGTNGAQIATTAQDPPKSPKKRRKKRPSRKPETEAVQQKQIRLKAIADYFEVQARWEDWNTVPED